MIARRTIGYVTLVGAIVLVVWQCVVLTVLILASPSVIDSKAISIAVGAVFAPSAIALIAGRRLIQGNRPSRPLLLLACAISAISNTVALLSGYGPTFADIFGVIFAVSIAVFLLVLLARPGER